MTGSTYGLMTRRLPRAAFTVALAVSLALPMGCGGSGPEPDSMRSGEPVSFEEIAQAATASADTVSGRFSLGLDLTVPGSTESFSFTGEGAFDTAANRASFSVDMSSFAALLGGFFAGLGAGDGDVPDFGDPDAWKIDAVRDGTVTYVRFPAISSELPAGKSWIRAEDGEPAAAGGFELGQLDQFTEADPRELLELLRSVAGEVETVGAEDVRGVETRHYRAALAAESLAQRVPDEQREDFRALADQLVTESGVAEVPFDIWLDADGLVRKFQLDVSAPQPGSSEPSRASLVFELWDLGEAVEIDLPPAAEVVEAAALRR